jgi:hypothetical protein
MRKAQVRIKANPWKLQIFLCRGCGSTSKKHLTRHALPQTSGREFSGKVESNEVRIQLWWIASISMAELKTSKFPVYRNFLEQSIPLILSECFDSFWQIILGFYASLWTRRCGGCGERREILKWGKRSMRI